MKPSRSTAPLLLAFAYLGLTTGLWGAEIAGVKERTGLSAQGLGLVLALLPVGTFVGLALHRRILARFSHGLLLAGAELGSAAVLVGLLNARSPIQVGLALLLLGVTLCQVNVAANHYGARLEVAEGRPLMASLHAPFGYGLATGAALVYIAHLVEQRQAATAVALVLVTVATAAASMRLAPMPGSAEQPERPTRTGSGGFGPRSLLIPAVAATCAVAESGISDWITVYLRAESGATTAVAALGFTALAAALTIGRMFGDLITGVLGDVRMVRLSGATTALGVVILLLSPTLVAAFVGVVVCGLGLSSLSPRILAAAGRAGDADPAVLTRVIGFSTVGSLAGPPLIGTTSAALGLPAAYALLAVLVGAVGASAGVLREHRATPTTTS
ncbi:MFS transporter [Pseudonocardia charpentierae]|uniref:Fucose permease n=1 Tax=Pseudonocardia charpentierae TaxID=3075545 RepID=A0ABU2NHD7_9PSEU|nr:hypothetical protein [Pseudonocardia sp. DSM 45834]MDT0353373.1 hypothetical protein [Pseudonocardia sp. DSM 45834]